MISKVDRREFLMAAGASAGFGVTTLEQPLAPPGRLRVARLKVDYLHRPLGLQNLQPRFSWCLESAERNVRQTAYRVLVASSEALLEVGKGDLWDSRKVLSSKSLGIAYKGQAIKSRQRCWWRVQVWDEAGCQSEASAASWWEMGLLSPADWTAQWVAADDALAKRDRDAPLQWIWAAATSDDRRKFYRHFRLPVPAKGGLLYTFGRSYENVTGIWLDGTALGGEIPIKNLIAERISLPDVSAGEHCLAIEVRLKNPYPEAFIGYTPIFGLAILARFDADEHIYLTSDSDWKTNLTQEPDCHDRAYDDQSLSAVTTSPVDAKLVPEPAFHLRREFVVNGEVVAARLYATALGCYEARLNGQRVGDALLTPEVSQYDRRVLYQVNDVKEFLRSGTNVVGLTVGDGWYGSNPRYGWGPPPRRVIAQLELMLADGSRQIVNTTPEWRISRSPILSSKFAVGETIDARLEQPGWDSVGFDDSDWQNVEVAARPSSELMAQSTPPIRATQILKPKAITSPRVGVYVFDFGQNFSGWCRLHVKGAVGTRIDLQFAEELNSSGEIDQFVLMGGKAADTFILRGNASGETFEPHFAYHGFRYAQVTGLPAPPTADSLDGVVIHSDLAITGRLRIGDPLIQQIWQNALWGQRSTFIAINTDEAPRDERWGYMTAGFWDSAAFNMDVACFARRQMDSVRDVQPSNGAFPMVAPAPAMLTDYDRKGTAPGWSDGGVILPWTIWRHYGDLEIILKNWDAMNRYLQFIHDHNFDYIWRNKRGDDYGDWQAIGSNHYYHPEKPPTTPLDLIGTAYWAYSAHLLMQMAEAIGRAEDALRLRSLYHRIRRAFNNAFVKPDGRVGNESQTSYVLALKFGLLPDMLRATAAERLVRDIRRRGMALSTGFLGTQFLLDVLAEAGYKEVVYSLLLRTEYPSWGFMIAQGATTMWETWDGDLQHQHNEGSHNHNMLGSVCAFLFRRIVGIDAAKPGFETIVIQPMLDPRLRNGGGDYDSVMGRISVDWVQREDGGLALDATIPANAAARIHLPVRRGSRVYESRKGISSRRDLRIVHRLDHEVVVDVGSGTFRFVVSR